MFHRNGNARINVKLIVILVLVVVALGISLVAARQVRRAILSEQSLTAGNAAYENEDWLEASKQFQEYLGRNPDDIEILKKYAKSRLAIRPIEGPNIMQTIAAYRRVMQLDPHDKEAYDQLAELYAAIGNFEELVYIADRRIETDPNDSQAPLWLAKALIHLNKIEDANQTLEKYIKDIEPLAERHDEYVQACVLMSGIVIVNDNSPQGKENALDWLDKAVARPPESAEAYANRSHFLRVTSDINDVNDEDRLIQARDDLEKADALNVENLRLRLLLADEWIAHGELDRAESQLEAIDSLPQEKVEEHFLDLDNWKATRFLFKSKLAMRRGIKIEDANLVDETLAALSEPRHRIQILPSAITLYLALGTLDKERISDARDCLDEYLEAIHTQQGGGVSRLRRAYLQAMVARAEERLYTVIDILRPVVINETSASDLFVSTLGLLSEAYSRTDQSRRAIDILRKYLQYRPDDSKMILQMAKEYIKLRDWNHAFETARLAETLDPTDILINLLRIESSIYLATGQTNEVNTTRLLALSEELKELRKKYPKRVEVRILQAMIANYLDKPEIAEKELKDAIIQCDEPLKAEMQLVGHYNRNKRRDEALNICQEACKSHSGVAEPWLALSNLYVAAAEYDVARDCLREGLEVVNGRWEVRSLSIRLALLELIYGDRADGIKLLRDVAARDPQEVRARSLLLENREILDDPNGVAEKLISELKKAEGESGLFWRYHEASLWLSSDDWRSKQQDITNHLQYCMDSDPEWSAPVLLLVKMYENLKDFKRVEEVCTQALSRNPSATDIANRLVSLFEDQGRYSDAEKVIEGIETNPQVISALNLRMSLSAGNFSKAIEELKLRISNDERDAGSRILLARLLYWQNKDVDQALAYLRDAEEITPNSMALTASKVSILRAEGQMDEARRILDAYVAGHKDDFTAYWMRAVYNTEQGEYKSAEEDYKKLTTFAKEGAIGYERLSNFYAGNNRLDDAISTLEEGLEAYPKNSILQRKLMIFLFQRNQLQDREKSIEILTALENKFPQDPDLLKRRAMLLLQQPTSKSVAVAIEKLEKAVRIAPTAVDAHLLLIEIAMGQGQYENARDYAIRAIGSNPNNAFLLTARSRTELALNNSQMAIQLGRLAIQEDPNNVATMIVLAHAYRLNGDMDRSDQWINQAEQLDPNNMIVFEARCLWLDSQKKYEQLAKMGSTLIAAKEGNLAKVLMVASVLSNANSKEYMSEAVKLFEYAIGLSPTTVEAKLGLASALYQAGSIKRAKTVYMELLEEYPDNIQVLNDLAWIFQEHEKNYKVALELVNKGLSLAPNDLYLLDTRGTIQANMEGRLAEARTDFETIERLSPSDSPRQAKALLKLGRICVKLNDPAKAKQYFQKASEIDQQLDIFTPDERLEISQIIQESGE